MFPHFVFVLFVIFSAFETLHTHLDHLNCRRIQFDYHKLQWMKFCSIQISLEVYDVIFYPRNLTSILLGLKTVVLWPKYFFLVFLPATLKLVLENIIFNRLSQIYCIKPEGRIH